MQIEIVINSGLGSHFIPYTENNLQWCKMMFEAGQLVSWEIIK
jgi:hypothetical protein